MKKIITIFLKCTFTAFAIWIIFTKADLKQIGHYLSNANIFYLSLTFIMVNVTAIISAARTRYYYRKVGLKIKSYPNLALHYVGMLFNIILPGGIGGDGYKAYYLKKRMNMSFITSVRLMVCNRVNGVLFLILITCFFIPFSNFFEGNRLNAMIFSILLMAITILGYSISARRILREPINMQLGAARYSFIVQLTVLLSGITMMYAMGYNGHIVDYIILFMVSCLISVLPISIGGVGLRELTFFKGAEFIGLDPELGVAMAVLYYVTTLVSSLIGLPFYWRLNNIFSDNSHNEVLNGST